MTALTAAEQHLAQPCLPESGCVICYPAYPLYPSPPKILTRFVAPPIPTRQYDWSALEEGYEPGRPIGYGETKADAIEDLKSQLDDREIADCNDHEDFSDRADDDDELMESGE